MRPPSRLLRSPHSPRIFRFNSGALGIQTNVSGEKAHMQRRRFLEFAGRLGAGLGIAGPLLGPQSLEALPNTDTAKRKSDQRTKGKKAPAPTALLDGEWLLATDPDNVGRKEQW